MSTDLEFDEHGDLVLSEAQIMRIARQIHLHYLGDIAQQQRLRGNRRLADAAWENLRQEDREQNIDQAREIPEKLKAVGRRMVRIELDQRVEFTEAEIEYLAELEHDRWWGLKIRQGYRYAPRVNDVRGAREHEDMIEYSKLPEATKEYDRIMMRDLLPFLREAGVGTTKVADPDRR
jgi:hypothetical protein